MKATDLWVSLSKLSGTMETLRLALELVLRRAHQWQGWTHLRYRSSRTLLDLLDANDDGVRRCTVYRAPYGDDLIRTMVAAAEALCQQHAHTGGVSIAVRFVPPRVGVDFFYGDTLAHGFYPIDLEAEAARYFPEEPIMSKQKLAFSAMVTFRNELFFDGVTSQAFGQPPERSTLALAMADFDKLLHDNTNLHISPPKDRHFFVSIVAHPPGCRPTKIEREMIFSIEPKDDQ